MKLTYFLMEQILRFDDFFEFNHDESVNILGVVRNISNTGFFVKWNVVCHYTGTPLKSIKWNYISFERLNMRIDLSFEGDRLKKLKMLKLKEEISNVGI